MAPKPRTGTAVPWVTAARPSGQRRSAGSVEAGSSVRRHAIRPDDQSRDRLSLGHLGEQDVREPVARLVEQGGGYCVHDPGQECVRLVQAVYQVTDVLPLVPDRESIQTSWRRSRSSASRFQKGYPRQPSSTCERIPRGSLARRLFVDTGTEDQGGGLAARVGPGPTSTYRRSPVAGLQ
jgi:hypothetical protein